MSCPVAVLLPISPAACSFQGTFEGRLYLSNGASLGRAPPNAANEATHVCVPGSWQQISGSHCNFKVSEQGVWSLQDTSSNGTTVGNRALKRGESAELECGEVIHLPATLPLVLTYEFVLQPDDRPELQAEAARYLGTLKTASKKRKLTGEGGSARDAGSGPVRFMQQQQKEMQRKWDEDKQRLAALGAEVQHLTTQNSSLKEAHDRQLLEKDTEMDRRLAAMAAAHAAALQAAKSTAEEDCKQSVQAIQASLAQSVHWEQAMSSELALIKGAKLELTKRLEAAQAEHAEVVEQRDSQLADVQKQLRSVTGERDDALSQVERGKQREQDFVKRAETAETVAENEQNERQKTRAQLEETQAERNRAQADAERLQGQLNRAGDVARAAEERALDAEHKADLKDAALHSCKDRLQQQQAARQRAHERKLEQDAAARTWLDQQKEAEQTAFQEEQQEDASLLEELRAGQPSEPSSRAAGQAEPTMTMQPPAMAGTQAMPALTAAPAHSSAQRRSMDLPQTVLFPAVSGSHASGEGMDEADADEHSSRAQSHSSGKENRAGDDAPAPAGKQQQQQQEEAVKEASQSQSHSRLPGSGPLQAC